jgi:hypothetical protein
MWHSWQTRICILILTKTVFFLMFQRGSKCIPRNRPKVQARFLNDLPPIVCSVTPGSRAPLRISPLLCCHFLYSSIRTYQNIIHRLEESICAIHWCHPNMPHIVGQYRATPCSNDFLDKRLSGKIVVHHCKRGRP